MRRGIRFNIEQEQPNLDENDQIQIRISSQIIQIRYYQLCKYSKLIEKEYTRQNIEDSLPIDIARFQRDFHIQDQNVITFFRIIKEENVEIFGNQFRDLFRLSEFFKVRSLQNFLIRYAQDNFRDINFIIDLMNDPRFNEICEVIQDNQLSLQMEQLLSNQIESCLENDKFGNLNISIIHRIISKSNIKSSDSLYRFIANSIQDRHILFSFLDISNLSDSNFNNLYNDYVQRKNTPTDFYYHYLNPNLAYIKKLRDDHEIDIPQLSNRDQQLSNEIQQLSNKNQQLSNKNQQLSNENQKLSNDTVQLSKKIQQSSSKNSELSEQIKNLKNDNKFLSDQLNNIPPFYKTQIQAYNKMIENQKKSFNIINNKSSMKNYTSDSTIDFEKIKIILSSFEKNLKNDKTGIFIVNS